MLINNRLGILFFRLARTLPVFTKGTLTDSVKCYIVQWMTPIFKSKRKNIPDRNNIYNDDNIACNLLLRLASNWFYGYCNKYAAIKFVKLDFRNTLVSSSDSWFECYYRISVFVIFGQLKRLTQDKTLKSGYITTSILLCFNYIQQIILFRQIVFVIQDTGFVTFRFRFSANGAPLQ